MGKEEEMCYLIWYSRETNKEEAFNKFIEENATVKTDYKKIEEFQDNELDSLIGKKALVFVEMKCFKVFDGEPYAWLNGEIIHTTWGKNNTFKENGKFPAITLKIDLPKGVENKDYENILLLPFDVGNNLLIKN